MYVLTKFAQNELSVRRGVVIETITACARIFHTNTHAHNCNSLPLVYERDGLFVQAVQNYINNNFNYNKKSTIQLHKFFEMLKFSSKHFSKNVSHDIFICTIQYLNI